MSMAAVAAVLMLAGCQEKDESPWQRIQAAVPSVQTSASTPEAAVESWWAAIDGMDKFKVRTCQETKAVKKQAFEKMNELLTADFSERRQLVGSCFETIMSREITEVVKQTELKALVLATVRNATPPTPGYRMTDREKQRKAQGERVAYSLERKDASSPWRIADLHMYEKFCPGLKNDEDWCQQFRPDRGYGNSFVSAFEF